MEIIRNCSHYSMTHIGIAPDSGGLPGTIVKTAFSEEGARSLKSERDGLLWYAGRRGAGGLPIASYIDNGDAFVRLEMPYHVGVCGDPAARAAKRTDLIWANPWWRRRFGINE